MIETLIRINIPSTQDIEYLPHEQGVYRTTLTKPSEGYGPYYAQWDSDTISTTRKVIGAVTVGLVSFTQKASLSDCEGDDESFFWNNSTQTLYVHFAFDDIPETAPVTIGIQGGYSYIGTKESIYIDDVEYQPRIMSLPNIKKKVDASQVGKMKFQDQITALGNGDGELDDFIQNPIPGAEASYVLFDTETDTELYYYTGFITSDKNTIEILTMKIQDKRRRENLKVPYTRFDSTTYPDMESKYIGKIIPEGYASHTGVKCFPTNGDATTPTNIDFKYATDATVLTEVRVKDDDVWSIVATASSTPGSGIFSVLYADATNASGAVLECVADVTLRSETNPGDVIKDMNDRYNSVTYDASSYDLTEWAAEKAKLADIALYMDKDQEFFKWIELIQNGSDLFFVYDIQGDGKRSLRVNDPNRAVTRTILYHEIKNDLKPVDRDFQEFSSTVTVLYSHNWQHDTDERVKVDTYEDAVLEKYQFSQDSEFPSLLTSQSDATDKADAIALDQSEARPIFTVVLHEDSLSGVTLKLYDVVTVNLEKPDVTYWEEVADEIYSDWEATDEIYSDWSATDEIYSTVGEKINSGGGREYWGSVTGTVLGLGYNPSDLSYTLTIRERA